MAKQTADEALVVRLEATLAKFEGQMKRAQAVANQTSTGMENRFGAASRKMAADADRAAKAVSRIGGGRSAMIQNMSFQLQDVAVQMASGTSASRALSQQLPQLLSGFGALGAVVGVAAAAGIPLISMLIGAGDEAVSLDDAIKGLTQASSDYRDAVESVLTPMGEMYAKFGQNAEAAREIQEVMLQLAKVRLSDAIAKVGQGVEDELGGLQSMVEEYRYLQDVEMKTPGMEYAAADAMKDILADIREEWGMTYDEAARVADAIDQMNAALLSGDEQAKAEAMKEMALALGDGLDNGIGLSEESQALLDNTAKAAIEQQSFAAQTADAAGSASAIASAPIAGNIGAGADQAARLAGNMAAAADAARMLAAQQALADKGKVYSGRGGGPRTSNQQGYGEFGRDSLDTIITDERKRLSAGSGGGKGGGGSSRDEYATAIESLQKRIDTMKAETAAYLEAASAQNLYGDAAEYAKQKAALLIAAQEEGKVITPELSAQIEEQARAYAQAALEAENAKEKMDEIADASERGKDALGEVFGSILEGSDAARKAIANLLMEIAKAQMMKGVFGLINSMPGGGAITQAIGGAMSFDGGGYTGGGSRSGGLDGKGGFLAMLHPRETVVDHTKSQRGASGPSSVAINVNVAGARGNAEIEQMVASGVRQGIAQYDRQMPDRQKSIVRDGRRR
jgi:hypothetical protein